MNRHHLIRIAAIAALIVMPTAAFAQSDPNWQWQQQHRQWNDDQDRGGYDRGYGDRGGNRDGQIGGVVSSFSPFNLYLDRGTHVELHQGTVINPTGITLQPGMRVQVYGYWNRDGSFAANEIDVNGRGRRDR
jgi:Domain of unknown function (DUF5666)